MITLLNLYTPAIESCIAEIQSTLYLPQFIETSPYAANLVRHSISSPFSLKQPKRGCPTSFKTIAPKPDYYLHQKRSPKADPDTDLQHCKIGQVKS